MPADHDTVIADLKAEIRSFDEARGSNRKVL